MTKYIVKIEQTLKYSDRLVAEFDELCKATMFVELILKTCKKVSATITVEADETELQEGEAESYE